MRRTRNTAGIPYSSAGRFGAFAVLVAAIAMLVLLAGYSDNLSNAGNGGEARLAGRNELVSADSRPGVSAAQRARAVRARRAAMYRARVAVRRAVARRRAARRAAWRRARRRVTFTVTVIRPGAGSFAGQNLCAPLPRGRSRAAHRARAYRRMQRRQALYNLNLHC